MYIPSYLLLKLLSNKLLGTIKIPKQLNYLVFTIYLDLYKDIIIELLTKKIYKENK